MPWQEITVIQEKAKFLEDYFLTKPNFSAHCKSYNISRKTGYQLLTRYAEEGLGCISHRSKKPHRSPKKTACFDDLIHAQQGFDRWLSIYNNTERPHEALGLKTPHTRYVSSPRVYLEKLPSIEYPNHMDVRKVQMGGLIHYKGKEYRVGDAFRGDPVGIVPQENDLAIIYYCHQKVLTIDLKNYFI